MVEYTEADIVPLSNAEESREAAITYHLVPVAVWEGRQDKDSYTPEAFDTDGFIHCTNGTDEVDRGRQSLLHRATRDRSRCSRSMSTPLSLTSVTTHPARSIRTSMGHSTPARCRHPPGGTGRLRHLPSGRSWLLSLTLHRSCGTLQRRYFERWLDARNVVAFRTGHHRNTRPDRQSPQHQNQVNQLGRSGL